MIEKYNRIDRCRCCDSNNLELILDLKPQPLANSYHVLNEKLDNFPLELLLCNNCQHLQLSVVVNPDLMFKNYLYVSGTTNSLKNYFNFFANFITYRYKNYFNETPKKILDIACNDGTQLDFFKELNIETYGIDPAENLYVDSSLKHNIICDYFPSKKLNGKYELIIAQNVFAHTHNIVEFIRECENLLSEKGIVYIQTSQANMVNNNEFDTIYHEHLSFFNTKSMMSVLKNTNLTLNNVFKFDIHGTSYIFEISKSKYDSNLESVLKLETENGLYNKDTYYKYSLNCLEISKQFKEKINDLRKEGYVIIGYGAAAKGMTFLNFANTYMDFIIDDNKLKQNLYTPGTNTKIVDVNFLNNYTEKDKIAFIPLAWNFFEEIRVRIKNVRENNKDIFIRYFPKLEINK